MADARRRAWRMQDAHGAAQADVSTPLPGEPMPSVPPAFGVSRLQQGWTLLQAMVVLVILAILAGIALPALTALLDRQRASSARHLLSTHLAHARMAAIHRRADVSLCASADGHQCADADRWAQGWIILVNPSRHATAPGIREVLHYERFTLPKGWRIASNLDRGRIRFLRDGRALGTNATLRICQDDRLHGKVVVNNSGRIRSETHPGTGACGQ